MSRACQYICDWAQLLTQGIYLYKVISMACKWDVIKSKINCILYVQSSELVIL